MVLEKGKDKGKSNDERRFDCYKAEAPIVHKKAFAYGERISLGMCLYDYIRGCFPDPEYMGFRYSDVHSDQE